MFLFSTFKLHYITGQVGDITGFKTVASVCPYFPLFVLELNMAHGGNLVCILSIKIV